MNNKAMQDKLREGRAVDVSSYPREGRYYVIPFESDRELDYCDTKTERWIWSIGRRLSDGVILASLSSDLYQNPDFECLWLR